MEWSAKSIMVLIVLYTLLIMVFILLSRKQKQLSDKLLALYAAVEIIGMSKFFAGDKIFDIFPQYYFLTIPICYTYIPLFYLYFLSNFKTGFVFKKKHWAHFALFAFYQLYYSIRYLLKSIPEVQHLIGTKPTYIRIEWIVHETILNVQFIFYSFLLIISSKEILKSKPSPKNKSFLLVVLISYLAGIVISLVVTTFALFGVVTPIDMDFGGIMYFYAFFIILFFITIRKIESEKIRSDQRQILIDDTKATELEKYVFTRMTEQKIYLDPQLTLSGCAQQLNLGIKEFSFLLNHKIKKNFNEYISHFRIAYAKEMLTNHPEMTVQEIMYNSGFNSKAVFYSAFKRHTNLSPKIFRKNQ